MKIIHLFWAGARELGSSWLLATGVSLFSSCFRLLFRFFHCHFLRSFFWLCSLLTYFCTAQISKFQPKIVNIFSRMDNEFPIFFIFCDEFCIFLRFFMKFCPDFATNSRKEWRVSLFQLNLRKQIWKLPRIQNSEICENYS